MHAQQASIAGNKRTTPLSLSRPLADVAKRPASLPDTIEYLDVNDGTFSLARTIMQRDRNLAHALRDALNDQLQEVK